ncbi:glutamate--tRNA ligase [Oceanirhabdus seepicola]|uniref:Glutamate--tRNA ligase n=1 Tax=Oceanirhabdus seepicola TaxID=2828781 RepID=A0A9J6P049_9CLOT|nr:glutamate--tRNA ligase family protein [Oceanirhabdus seepicola]MCM1989245.1 glutamate--tRNA ligase [Oceanirhabdus seepicola]
MNNKKLADLLFPHVDKKIDFYFNKYPRRNLAPEKIVSRYAPSPTGFQHLGGMFASLIYEKSAHQSDGVFFIRIEDTDQKRLVAGGIDDVISALKEFNIPFDEGMIDAHNYIGDYGPYIQSDRKEIYQTFVKNLVEKGLAYPCFLTEDEISNIREKQMNEKLLPGCWGEWAKYSDCSLEEYEKLIQSDVTYVIRLKSPGSPENRIDFIDSIRGKISMPENILHVVLMKNDGLPTYHFAHAVDDMLMRTTDVIRGEEWLPSVPIHLQLFDVLGYPAPKYAHIPTLMKMDGTSKRKLSKRKDPELSLDYYRTKGYDFSIVKEYLLTLINSDYEDWKRDNPHLSPDEFKISFSKMNSAGALFDIDKLNHISKDRISLMSAEEIYTKCLEWSEKYDSKLNTLLKYDKEYFINILNIDRLCDKPRKDIAVWSEVFDYISYFYDSLFSINDSQIKDMLPSTLSLSDAKSFISGYLDNFSLGDSKEVWFNKLKSCAIDFGFAKNKSQYKKAPDQYKGVVADAACIIRILLTGRTSSPDLFSIMKVLGEDRVLKRLNYFK